MTTRRCDTCTRLIARDQGTAPLWDAIYRADFWDVAHSCNTSLAGWLVLIARRHIETIAELTQPEALELGLLLKRVSHAVQAATGCVKTYVVQFAEADEHPHVHFHIVPRMADQPRERCGPHVFAHLGVAEHERVDEATMNELARRIRAILEANQGLTED
ncbi:MAG: HIT family protein [Chloroflexales bacterium]|nr:HIT family protein [Chloroflexales bacterium]